MSTEHILENKDLYIHQYLTGIFQIYLNPNNDDETSMTEDEINTNSNDLPLLCITINGAGDQYLSFSNYSHYVFENLMDQNIKEAKLFIDKRFFPRCFSMFSYMYRACESYSNRIAYLFDCYCRFEFIEDFAHLIPQTERKKLKRYIIDQAALLLVMPYMNIRYSKTDGQSPSITPFDDMFHVLTMNISFQSNYLSYVKKFFFEITEAIYVAKSGNIQEQDYEYTSSLEDVSSEELNLEQIVKPLYERFRKKFSDEHFFNTMFIDDIKYLNLLVASPVLSEIFIDLNSPPQMRESETSGNSSKIIGPSNRLLNQDDSSPISNNNNIRINPLREIFLNLENDTLANTEKFFQNSLIGILLSSSPLPSQFSKVRQNNNPLNILLFNHQDYEYQFFKSPSLKTTVELEKIEMEIDDCLIKLRSNMTDIFYSLLKSPPFVRTKTLKWIEYCLATFNNRAKLWANEIFSLVSGNTSHVSDGFMLNFSAVLLNLCKPFCSIADNDDLMFTLYPNYSINLKMLKIDPLYIEYCRRGNSSINEWGPYLYIYKQESMLINSDSKKNPNEVTINEDYQPNFITRCFFMTHKALQISFRVVHERFTTINQENTQLQRRLANHGLDTHNIIRNNLNQQQREILSRFDQNMTISLSMKATLTETNYVNLLLEFYLATASWINNLAVCATEEEAAAAFKKLEFDGTQTDYFKLKSSKCLKWIPEFIVENIIDFVLFLRYFEIKPKILSLKTGLEPFLVMIVLFMGSPNRMRNPHLRAKMAEMLEALLPSVQANILPCNLETLFLKPYFVEELFPALLNGFVSIEISDEVNNTDVVAFEQKFNYRRPMYVVFKYLCTIEQHQQKLIDLALYAESNIDCVQSPIFLRFINLLINDAIFLLDEGLSLMSKLRELQTERESESWAQMSTVARQQNEANFIHLGRLAKFHNFIGRDTIATLATITSYVKSFFSHRVLMDRMASMLNYFLHNLVGPNKRNFKVKQMNDYEFNPAELVKNISRIYVNLACNNPISLDPNTIVNSNLTDSINPKYEQFCLAIGRDDRSYSPDLLIKAEDILSKKLGQPMLGQDILTVDKSVKELVRRHKNSEIPLDDIPEEFLDPLMSTLMNDPVILPNSHKVLDRATIVRHLLSDHTDPYTRAPLTMDMLVPDLELKKRIEDFVEAKLKEMNKEDS